MSRSNKEDTEQKLTYASTLIERKLATLDSSNETLNTKLGSLLGFQGVIVTLGVGLVINTSTHGYYLIPFSLGLFAILISIIGVIWIMSTVEFIDPPYTGVMWSKESLKLEYTDYKNQMISDMVAAYDANVKQLDRRGKNFNRILVIFGVGLILIAASIIAIGGNSVRSESTKTQYNHRQSRAEGYSSTTLKKR
jgi:hypothetical protein